MHVLARKPQVLIAVHLRLHKPDAVHLADAVKLALVATAAEAQRGRVSVIMVVIMALARRKASYVIPSTLAGHMCRSARTFRLIFK